MLKVTDKKKNLKVAKGKWFITYKMIQINFTVGISVEKMKDKRQWNDILNMLQKTTTTKDLSTNIPTYNKSISKN
jgi:hypothetical protein